MYFYSIFGGTHDESFKSVYYSQTLYSQEEFEDIIIKGFKYVCEVANSKRDFFTRCFGFNSPGFIFWNEDNERDDPFNDWIEKNSDLRVVNNYNGSMNVGICTTPSEDTFKLLDSIDYSKVRDCKDNCFFKDKWRNEDCYYIKEKATKSFESQEGLEFVNKYKIYEFIACRNDFFKLLNESFTIIRKYFPQSVIYLEYIKIKEPPYFGAIQASIDPKEEDNKNKETFKNKLLPEFIKLRNSYKGCRYRIDLISDEDLSKIKMSS